MFHGLPEEPHYAGFHFAISESLLNVFGCFMGNLLPCELALGRDCFTYTIRWSLYLNFLFYLFKRRILSVLSEFPDDNHF